MIVMALTPPRLKVLEQFKVSPPKDSVPQTSIPLTFFDIPWLLFAPSQPIFFYDFPHSVSHFQLTLLPNLIHSLSLTLQHFFPFAANLAAPQLPSSKPHFLYSDGDFVSLTVAESTGDFAFLSGHHRRRAQDLHHLLPIIQPSYGVPFEPVLAVQLTVFPGSGICMGIVYRYPVADERTLDNFLKSWAAVCRVGDGLASPSHDRSVIHDRDGLEAFLLREWWRSSEIPPNNFCRSKSTISSEMVRSTFVVGRPDMEEIKKWILTRSTKKPGFQALLLSPYVLACSVVWVCWIRTHWPRTESSGNGRHYFGFIAGGIHRLDFPVPANYFGNCVGFGRAAASRKELLGEDGVLIAAKSIGDTIMKLNEDILGGVKNWMSDWKEMLDSDLHVTVAGSPKVDFYGLDFGWGRPRKIEEGSTDQTGAISLRQSRDFEGGVEVGLSLPRVKMETFGSLFTSGLKAVFMD